MKTNIIAQHPSSLRPPHGISVFDRFKGFGRLLLAVVCASLVSFASVPAALAAAPNGEYGFVSATGSITAGGDTLELPQDLLQEIGAIQNGKIVVENNKVQLNRKAALRIIKEIGEQFGIEFETTITGPKSVELRKSGKKYVGSTTKPVIVTFSTTFEGEEISGNIKTFYNVTVKGNTLTMKIPISGKALGRKFTGELTIVCKR